MIKQSSHRIMTDWSAHSSPAAGGSSADDVYSDKACFKQTGRGTINRLKGFLLPGKSRKQENKTQKIKRDPASELDVGWAGLTAGSHLLRRGEFTVEQVGTLCKHWETVEGDNLGKNAHCQNRKIDLKFSNWFNWGLKTHQRLFFCRVAWNMF